MSPITPCPITSAFWDVDLSLARLSGLRAALSDVGPDSPTLGRLLLECRGRADDTAAVIQAAYALEAAIRTYGDAADEVMEVAQSDRRSLPFSEPQADLVTQAPGPTPDRVSAVSLFEDLIPKVDHKADPVSDQNTRTKVDCVEALRMREEGKSLRAIGEVFGCNASVVHQSMARYIKRQQSGCASPKLPGRARKVDPIGAVRLRGEGKSYREIGEVFGTTAQAACQAVNKEKERLAEQMPPDAQPVSADNLFEITAPKADQRSDPAHPISLTARNNLDLDKASMRPAMLAAGAQPIDARASRAFQLVRGMRVDGSRMPHKEAAKLMGISQHELGNLVAKQLAWMEGREASRRVVNSHAV